jgi:hypothetical protein
LGQYINYGQQQQQNSLLQQALSRNNPYGSPSNAAIEAQYLR